MTTHYTAQLDNVTFTRSTQNRTYTHCVAYRKDIALERAQAERNANERWDTNLQYHQDLVSGKSPAHITPATGFHASYGAADAQGNPTVKYAEYVAKQNLRHAETVARAQAELDRGRIATVLSDLAVFDARVATSSIVSSDGKDFIYEAGWCGRPDLAQKLAAQYSRAVILDAVVVAKPAKASKSKSTRTQEPASRRSI